MFGAHRQTEAVPVDAGIYAGIRARGAKRFNKGLAAKKLTKKEEGQARIERAICRSAVDRLTTWPLTQDCMRDGFLPHYDTDAS